MQKRQGSSESKGERRPWESNGGEKSDRGSCAPFDGHGRSPGPRPIATLPRAPTPCWALSARATSDAWRGADALARARISTAPGAQRPAPERSGGPARAELHACTARGRRGTRSRLDCAAPRSVSASVSAPRDPPFSLSSVVYPPCAPAGLALPLPPRPVPSCSTACSALERRFAAMGADGFGDVSGHHPLEDHERDDSPGDPPPYESVMMGTAGGGYPADEVRSREVSAVRSALRKPHSGREDLSATAVWLLPRAPRSVRCRTGRGDEGSGQERGARLGVLERSGGGAEFGTARCSAVGRSVAGVSTRHGRRAGGGTVLPRASLRDRLDALVGLCGPAARRKATKKKELEEAFESVFLATFVSPRPRPLGLERRRDGTRRGGGEALSITSRSTPASPFPSALSPCPIPFPRPSGHCRLSSLLPPYFPPFLSSFLSL